MNTIEFEKTANGQTRYKWSNRPTSNFILNALNATISYNDARKQISIELGLKYSERITFTKDQLTSINGGTPPDTVEEIMQMLTDEVFGG